MMVATGEGISESQKMRQLRRIEDMDNRVCDYFHHRHPQHLDSPLPPSRGDFLSECAVSLKSAPPRIHYARPSVSDIGEM